MKKRDLIIVALMVVALSGCYQAKGRQIEQEERLQENIDAILAFRDTEEVLQKPEEQIELPSIDFIDVQESYGTDFVKMVQVQGDDLPDFFYIKDIDSQETVMEGKIKQLSQGQAAVGIIDFTDFQDVGEYLLCMDGTEVEKQISVIPCGYGQVLQDFYGKLFEGDQWMEMSMEDWISLLLAYQWYPEAFSFTDEDRELPEVLERAAEYANLQKEEKRKDFEFVAFWAHLGYLYKGYDSSYSDKCLKNARQMYDKLSKKQMDEFRFMALAQLYRLTGWHKYQKEIENAEELVQKPLTDLNMEAYSYGALTYMASDGKSDLDLCEEFMDVVQRQAEEAGNHLQEMFSGLDFDADPNDLLHQSFMISNANYIMANYHYRMMLRKTLYLLTGGKQDFNAYFPETGNIGKYILILSQLSTNDDWQR